jgi:hypothetical protein
MQTVELEKDKPIPKLRASLRYPHSEMDVGDSFVVPKEWKQNVMNANSRAGKRLGCKFSAKTEGDVVRTWRVA